MQLSNEYRPIFLVGMNGSGTTLLLDCLDNHPQIYGFKRETKVIPYFISRLEKYGDLKRDENFLALWNDFRKTHDFVVINKGVAPPLPENWKSLPRTLATVINGVFQYFASQEGKYRWCEKTPMHALHISALSNVFPDARFIHIIRDGRACAASFHRRWGYSPELTMYRWKNVVNAARAQGKEIPGKYLEITYEDLVTAPEKIMYDICKFLSIDFHENVLYPSRTRQVTTGSTIKEIVKKKEIWPDYFSKNMISRLETIAGSSLHQLGYKTGKPGSDYNPPQILRVTWLYYDYIRLTLKEISQALNSRSSVKEVFTMVHTKISRALKQRRTTKY